MRRYDGGDLLIEISGAATAGVFEGGADAGIDFVEERLRAAMEFIAMQTKHIIDL